MTIGLGFRCSDGLVIASDTKESDGLTKRYVDKIYTVRDGDFSCALTAAGTADLIEMFSHELRTQLTKCPRTSRTWPVLELISKGILTTLFDESIVPFLSHPKDERPSMSALVGFCLDGKTSLYEMRPPRTVLSVREHHAATGFGDFAAVPLLDRFHLKRQTMKATSDLAAYILKHVKAGVDHCEGDSDIVLQGNDGTIYGYNPGWKGHVHIAAMEKWGDEVDRAIGMLFKAATKPRWMVAYCAAVLALNTTMRSGELKGLRWKNVDLFKRTLRVKRSTTKTDAGERVIPLNRDAMWALEQLWDRCVVFTKTAGSPFSEVRPEHCVFPACENYRMDLTVPMKSWRSAWRSLTKEAGLKGLRFHDLRHSSITILAEAGLSDQTVMSIAGHVSTKMLQHYSHIRLEAKRTAVQALEGASTIQNVASLERAEIRPN